MQYNSTLFGVKQDVSTSAGQYLYSVATKNCNLQAGLKSGDFVLNDFIDDSAFYWLIGKNSPYTRYTLSRRTGSLGSYTWIREHTENPNLNVPVALSITGLKHDSDGNIASSGTASTDYTTFVNRRLSENQFTQTGNVTNPIWYSTEDLTGGSEYRQSTADIITDFDYNNIILKIKVNGLDNASTYDLANYNNISTNWITSIGYTVYAGVINNTFTGRKLTSTSGRYIGGTNYSGSGGTQNGAQIFTDYHYKTPMLLGSWYQKDEFSIPKHLTNNTFGSYIILGSETGTSTTFGVNFYMDPDHWELNDDNSGYRLIKHGEDIYSEDDFNYIRKCIAYLGFWFTDGGQNQTSVYREDALLGENANNYADPDDIPDKVYQAEIKDGITTGNFTELALAKDNDQSKWGTDWRDKNQYNGRTGSDDKNHDTGNLKTTLRYSDIPSNTKNYALTNDQLQSLITWCNNGFNVTDSDQFLEDFKGLNPSDCIISAIYFPFNVGSLSSASIHVGNLDTGITAEWALYGANAYGGSEFTYTPLTIQRRYNDFRDYAPYTTIDIYIPFCGAVSLNPADVYGYDITISIIPDLNTGSCTGCVYRGDYLLTTKDGQIGMPIALSLGQVGTFQNAVKQAQYNLQSANNAMFTSWLGACASVGAIATGAGAGVGIAGLAGSAMGILNADRNIKKAEYDLEHIARSFNTVGTVSDVNNVMVLPEYVHAIIKRPVDLYPDDDMTNYAHTVGYACNKQGQLKDFTGYTIISDCDLSGISCTASEKESIDQILKRGVIV